MVDASHGGDGDDESMSGVGDSGEGGDGLDCPATDVGSELVVWTVDREGDDWTAANHAGMIDSFFDAEAA